MIQISRIVFTLVVTATVLQAATADAAKRGRRTREEATKVELFSAMDEGTIEVRFIPKDVTSATVLVANKTDKPLTVELPDAFVAVLAQFGGGGMGGMGGGGMGGMGGMGGGMGGGGQAMGGGMGGMGGGMGGMGGGMGGMGGGGMMSVMPERVRKVKVPTICLEHGKADPTPRMKYVIRPITAFTKDEQVIEVCKMLGRREITQNVAQAATWNLASGLSWSELATKNRVELRSVNYFERYFSPAELAAALRVTGVASQRALGTDDNRNHQQLTNRYQRQRYPYRLQNQAGR